MSVTDRCHEYGISRPTAYKWIKRYDEVGPDGPLDLTRAPHSSPRERELASGEHSWSDPQPRRSHQPEKEETAGYAEFATVLDGHDADSALVHGFSRLLPDRRRLSLRSLHDHRCA